MGKISLKELAEEAGVSITTVSRVVNDPEQVRSSTRDAVYEVMRKRGYEPALKAEKARDRKGAVALITSHSSSEFFTDFILALQEEFAKQGRDLLLVNTAGEDSLSSFIRRRSGWADLVDAAVVFYCEIDRAARDFFQGLSLPVVTVHSRCPYFYSVMNNDYLGGYDAAAHLWQKGYRRLGLIFWNSRDDEEHDGKFRDRKAGFRRFLEEKGAPLDRERQQEIDDMTIEGGFRATRRLWERFRPEGIFYACDTMAVGGLEFCRERNIQVPRELALMGFDDIRMAEAMNLSTMNQFIPAKARAVCRRLQEALDGAVPPAVPEEVTITPVVVERKTT